MADSLRGYYRSYVFPEACVQVKEVRKDGGDLLVTVVSNVYVPVTALTVSDDRTHFSDNYFKLYPGRGKTVRIIGCSEDPQVQAVKMTPGEIREQYEDKVEF